MITKEEIVEILCNHGGYMDRSRTEQGVHEDNFDDVADEILSQLHQPTVISVVCDCEKKVYDLLMSGEVKCLRCSKTIAQTDL